jgi:hypothetical protein
MRSDSDLHEPRTNAEQGETGDDFRVSYESQCTIYFIGETDRGPVKIGYARDLWARVRAIQNSCPVKLDLLAALTGGRSLEREYHERFKQWRLHGEWFERSDAIEEEIFAINYVRPLVANIKRFAEQNERRRRNWR